MVLATMSTLRTTLSVHNHRRSPQIANRHDSPESPRSARARRAVTPDIPNEPSPIFGHFAQITASHTIKKKYLRVSASLRRNAVPPAPQAKPNPRSPLRKLLPKPQTPPSSPSPELYFLSKLSILGRFGSFRARCLKSWSSATGQTPLKAV
jgi:hypothetical protein